MIVGMMRIKNEQRWIARVLTSMLPLCEKIFILDDHSTDETRHICRSFPEVQLWESEFDGVNEVRDKNFLISKVEEAVPEGSWILAIDGDEEIAGGGQQIIAETLALNEGYAHSFRFQVQYLWDSETQWRTDGIYREFFRPSMFRLRFGQRFFSPAGGGFHCGNVPEARYSPRTGVKLLHYGYMHRSDRIRKFEWYNAPDKRPIPLNEDGYRHMVIGDLFPSDSAFLHAGPLRLELLCR